MKKDYEIISSFVYSGNNFLVVRMTGAACTMSIDEYNRMIMAERKYLQRASI